MAMVSSLATVRLKMRGNEGEKKMWSERNIIGKKRGADLAVLG